MVVDESIEAAHAKQRKQQTNQNDCGGIMGKSKQAAIVHQVECCFADNINHCLMWPDPLLSNSMCL
jgi:hypothetical protein